MAPFVPFGGRAWGCRRPPSGQWPRALWRGSGSLVALCEALRKLCSALHLGCPGARRPLETAARREQNAPRPPPALREQGQPHQGAVASLLFFQDREQLELSLQAWLDQFSVIPFLALWRENLNLGGRGGIVVASIRGAAEVPSGSAPPLPPASLCASG